MPPKKGAKKSARLKANIASDGYHIVGAASAPEPEVVPVVDAAELAANATGCNCPSGCLMDGPILANPRQRPRDAVPVECSNVDCPFVPFVHIQCYDRWEAELVKRMLNRGNRSKHYTIDKVVNDLWRHIPHELRRMSCMCPCGGSLVRPVLDEKARDAAKQQRNREQAGANRPAPPTRTQFQANAPLIKPSVKVEELSGAYKEMQLKRYRDNQADESDQPLPASGSGAFSMLADVVRGNNPNSQLFFNQYNNRELVSAAPVRALPARSNKHSQLQKHNREEAMDFPELGGSNEQMQAAGDGYGQPQTHMYNNEYVMQNMHYQSESHGPSWANVAKTAADNSPAQDLAALDDDGGYGRHTFIRKLVELINNCGGQLEHHNELIGALLEKVNTRLTLEIVTDGLLVWLAHRAQGILTVRNTKILTCNQSMAQTKRSQLMSRSPPSISNEHMQRQPTSSTGTASSSASVARGKAIRSTAVVRTLWDTQGTQGVLYCHAFQCFAFFDPSTIHKDSDGCLQMHDMCGVTMVPLTEPVARDARCKYKATIITLLQRDEILVPPEVPTPPCDRRNIGDVHALSDTHNDQAQPESAHSTLSSEHSSIPPSASRAGVLQVQADMDTNNEPRVSSVDVVQPMQSTHAPLLTAALNSLQQPAPQAISEPQATAQAISQPQTAPQAFNQPQAAPQAFNQPQTAPQAFIQPQTAPQAFNQPQTAPQAINQPQALSAQQTVNPAVTRTLTAQQQREQIRARITAAAQRQTDTNRPEQHNHVNNQVQPPQPSAQYNCAPLPVSVPPQQPIQTLTNVMLQHPMPPPPPGLHCSITPTDHNHYNPACPLPSVSMSSSAMSMHSQSQTAPIRHGIGHAPAPRLLGLGRGRGRSMPLNNAAERTGHMPHMSQAQTQPPRNK